MPMEVFELGEPGRIAEKLADRALSDIRSGLDAIPMLSAAIAACRIQAGELPLSELDELRALAEGLEEN